MGVTILRIYHNHIRRRQAAILNSEKRIIVVNINHEPLIGVPWIMLNVIHPQGIPFLVETKSF